LKLWKLWSKDSETFVLFIVGFCDGEDEWNLFFAVENAYDKLPMRRATVLSGIPGAMERMESNFF
jgi:hypothetical protein